ncbi:MAG: cystathionine beta-lyase [Burkholderiaceae bacterium]|jgi:cystathionine beta-lyase|nr:cystathionine beta-lyase [Burkholderiaceae bacterium]
MGKRKAKQTRILHSDYRPPERFAAFPPPTYRASTVLFDTPASLRARDWRSRDAYTYGLHGTPTTFTLESQIAAIEGGEYCILAPSGLAAITLVDFAFLRAGDAALIPENVYGPNRELGDWLASDFDISVRYYDPLIGEGIADLICPNTRLVWTEAPGSVTMEVPDIPSICRAAHEKGAIVALDNTWSAGLGFDAFAHGVDVSLQALTKYHSGGSDLLMGALITREESLHHRIGLAHMRLGMGIGADDAYQVLRSLSTMSMRYRQHGESGMAVAQWLGTCPQVSLVLHPALPDCPGHALYQRDFTAPGGLFSFLFHPRYTEQQTDRFIEALQLFKLGFSWGGVHSLCVPYRIHAGRKDWQHRDKQLLRLYIGLEAVDDLIDDLAQAFRVMDAAPGAP